MAYFDEDPSYMEEKTDEEIGLERYEKLKYYLSSGPILVNFEKMTSSQFDVFVDDLPE